MPSIRELMGEEAQAPPPEEQPMGRPVEEEAAGPTPWPQEEVGEQEQADYEKVVMAAADVLYDKSTSPEIVKMLEAQAENPAQAIAGVVVMLIVQLDEQSGGTMPEGVILPAAGEITELVSELADAKVFPVDEALMNQAAQHMLMMLAEQYGVDDEEVQSLLNEVDAAGFEQYQKQQHAYGNPQEAVGGN